MVDSNNHFSLLLHKLWLYLPLVSSEACVLSFWGQAESLLSVTCHSYDSGQECKRAYPNHTTILQHSCGHGKHHISSHVIDHSVSCGKTQSQWSWAVSSASRNLNVTGMCYITQLWAERPNSSIGKGKINPIEYWPCSICSRRNLKSDEASERVTSLRVCRTRPGNRRILNLTFRDSNLWKIMHFSFPWEFNNGSDFMLFKSEWCRSVP